MVLAMKNPTFKVGWGFKKNEYRGGRLPKKGRLGLFTDLRSGGLGKKEGGGVCEGDLKPQCTLCIYKKQTYFSTYLV